MNGLFDIAVMNHLAQPLALLKLNAVSLIWWTVVVSWKIASLLFGFEITKLTLE